MNDSDRSNGYEDVAQLFIARRGTRPAAGDAIGAAMIRVWAHTLPIASAVLDLGSGPGEPTTRILHDAGLRVYAVDASPTMVAALHARFPDVAVECNTVEASTFFDRFFAGILAWGLLFLLEPDAQAHVIAKVGRALTPHGLFLFTAPRDPAEWNDAMTGRRSQSLGVEAYERLLNESGMTLVEEGEDEGENHYYFAERR